VREALRLAGGAAHDTAELLENLRVDGTRMRENLGLTGGRILSEGFADRYEPLLGRRDARRAVTSVLASHPGPGGSLADLLARDPRTAGLVDAAELRALDDPAAHLGSAAALVERALTRQDDADRPHDGGEGP
jgi:3-carboxy-cis,cis-muconate cycloisomerase